MSNILIVPGLHNSGPHHWQSLWHQQYPHWQRVTGQTWERANLQSWSHRIARVLQHNHEPVHIVAHSFGTLASIAAAARHPERVASLFLVAPADPAHFAIADRQLPLPPDVPGLVVASRNDPWMSLERADYWRRPLTYRPEFEAGYGIVDLFRDGSFEYRFIDYGLCLGFRRCQRRGCHVGNFRLVDRVGIFLFGARLFCVWRRPGRLVNGFVRPLVSGTLVGRGSIRDYVFLGGLRLLRRQARRGRRRTLGLPRRSQRLPQRRIERRRRTARRLCRPGRRQLKQRINCRVSHHVCRERPYCARFLSCSSSCSRSLMNSTA